jgi:RNA polymerase sigma-70 factor (ECF subfamily)
MEDRKELHFTEYWSQAEIYLKGFLRARIYSERDRDDILQEIALAAWKKFPDLDQKKGSFRSWVLGIARIECLKYMRSVDSDKNIFDEELLESAARVEAEAHDSIQDIYRNLENCIKKLPEDKVSLLRMKYYQKMAIVEMASEFGISEAATKERLYRLRKDLKLCVKRSSEQ